LVGCEKQFSTKEPQEVPLPKNHRKLQENHNVFNEYSRQNANAIDLKVYGIENLRIADGSIMPRVTTGNTMAPCVIIGERAGDILKADHKL
jgi:GMC oxidoreductase